MIEVRLLSRRMAEARIPKEPELLIGFLNSKMQGQVPTDTPADVPRSDLRLDYLTYVFDDIDYEMAGFIRYDEKMADRILKDIFRYVKEGRMKSLAIHCYAGLGRTPGFAEGLIDGSLGSGIFNCDEWFSEYPIRNLHVSQVTCDAMKRKLAALKG